MKIRVMLLLLVGCGSLQAQNTGWARLGSLPPGTKLVVTTSHSAPCLLEGFSDQGMACGFRGQVYWVDRARITRVSLEKHSHAVAVGTAIGAAAGGAITAARAGGTDQAKAISVLLGIGLGGWLGYGIGHLVPRSEGAVLYDGWATGP